MAVPISLSEQLTGYPVVCVSPYVDKDSGIPYPCGRCFICRLKRQRLLRSFMIQDLESSQFYPMLVTLTYSPDNVPSFVPYINENKTELLCPNPDVNGKYISIRINDNEINKLAYVSHTFLSHNERRGSITYKELCTLNIDGQYSKTNYRLPCFRYYDVQKYLKRLRRFLERKGLESRLRYYCTAEYGSTFFRPHYHLLLFFSNESSRAAVLQHETQLGSCKSLWPLGSTNYQYYTGNDCRYLANYLTCSNNLPSLYKYPPFRQFCRRSNRIWGNLTELPKALFSSYSTWKDVFKFFFEDYLSSDKQSVLSSQFSYSSFLPYVRFFNRFGSRLDSRDLNELFSIIANKKALEVEYNALCKRQFNVDFFVNNCWFLYRFCNILHIGLNQLQEAVKHLDANNFVTLPSVILNGLYFISIHLRGFKTSNKSLEDYWRFVQHLSYSFDYYCLVTTLYNQEKFFNNDIPLIISDVQITRDFDLEQAYYYPYTDTSMLENLIPNYHPFSRTVLQHCKIELERLNVHQKEAKHLVSHTLNMF